MSKEQVKEKKGLREDRDREQKLLYKQTVDDQWEVAMFLKELKQEGVP